MRSIYEMNGTEKAAALLVSLGADVAAEVMKHLDDESVQRLGLEIARIGTISVTEKENLIGEFLLDLRKTKRSAFGGENVAREMLAGAFGDEKAAEILKKLTRQNLEKGFDFIKDIDTEALVSFLQNEHPQTIAVALAYLPAAKSAQIVQALPPEIAKDAAKRMARMEKTSPEAVIEIARIIRKRYEESRSTGRYFESAGGMDVLVDILSHMSGEQEKRLMDHFDHAMPAMSQEIRDRIYTFENIANLTNNEMRILIDELADDAVIARSLKGAGDEIRFKFLRNMSRNRAADILDDMKAMGPMRTSEILEARDQAVAVMRRLNNEGMIVIRKEREKFVE